MLMSGSAKKPLTSVSKRVPGVHGKRGLERGWQKRLAKGWRKVGGFPCALQFRNSRGARLETLVCDSMEVGVHKVGGEVTLLSAELSPGQTNAKTPPWWVESLRLSDCLKWSPGCSTHRQAGTSTWAFGKLLHPLSHFPLRRERRINKETFCRLQRRLISPTKLGLGDLFFPDERHCVFLPGALVWPRAMQPWWCFVSSSQFCLRCSLQAAAMGASPLRMYVHRRFGGTVDGGCASKHPHGPYTPEAASAKTASRKELQHFIFVDLSCHAVQETKPYTSFTSDNGLQSPDPLVSGGGVGIQYQCSRRGDAT